MPVSAMKLVNGGRGGGGGGAGGGGGEKTAFSFKKCSAFQFVKRKVSSDWHSHTHISQDWMCLRVFTDTTRLRG